MIEEVCIWHHQGDSRPIGAESTIRCHNVDVFELIHCDVMLAEQVRILLEHGVELLPLSEEFVLALFGIFDEGWVLEVLEIFVLPVHEDVGLVWP